MPYIFIPLCALAVFFSSCTSLHVRPLTVRVVERESGKPLKDIPVYYGLETIREEPSILFVIPNPYPLSYKMEKGEKGFTDSSGEISFGPYDLLLRKTESINRELIYVNLDLNGRTRRAHFETNLHDPKNVLMILSSFGAGLKRMDMVNPAGDHRGAFIISPARGMPRQEELGDIILIQDIRQNDQTLTIELGRN